ncbi:MAG: sporulation transcription factor Spo0A [Candidatus Caccovivens sp.]
MKPKIKVVIIEDNAIITQMLNDLISEREDIEIVETCTNGVDGMTAIDKHNPDVVILDIIMPECDGFTVIKTEKLKHPECKFIVLSSLNQDTFVTKALEVGASYYIMKPFQKSTLIERIYDVCKAKDESTEFQNFTQKSISCEEREQKLLNIKLSTMLMSVGIPANAQGYQYLRSAIILVFQHPDYTNSITKQVYPIVAKQYNTTPASVERSIRHAIEIAWNRGKIDKINGVFGIELFGKYDRPTNGELIALLANKLLLESA